MVGHLMTEDDERVLLGEPAAQPAMSGEVKLMPMAEELIAFADTMRGCSRYYMTAQTVYEREQLIRKAAARLAGYEHPTVVTDEVVEILGELVEAVTQAFPALEHQDIIRRARAAIAAMAPE